MSKIFTKGACLCIGIGYSGRWLMLSLTSRLGRIQKVSLSSLIIGSVVYFSYNIKFPGK